MFRILSKLTKRPFLGFSLCTQGKPSFQMPSAPVYCIRTDHLIIKDSKQSLVELSLTNEQWKFHKKNRSEYYVPLVAVPEKYSDSTRNKTIAPVNASTTKKYYQIGMLCKVVEELPNKRLAAQTMSKVMVQQMNQIQCDSLPQAPEQVHQQVKQPQLSGYVKASWEKAKQHEKELAEMISKNKQYFYITDKLKEWEDAPLGNFQTEGSAWAKALKYQMKKINERLGIVQPLIETDETNFHNSIDSLINGLYRSVLISVDRFQQCYQQTDPKEKLKKATAIAKQTKQMLMVSAQAQQIGRQEMFEKQLKYSCHVMLRILKSAIEGGEQKQKFIMKVTQDFNEKNPSEIARRRFNEEVENYITMEDGMESSKTKQYISELAQIPYDMPPLESTFSVKHARDILDQHHYGLKQVKDQILETMAAGKSKGNLTGKSILLVGPPGIGKTSLAESIAKALGRKLYPVALAGVSDSSVLKGHRRTYIGAYAGNIINALKSAGHSNIVILLDQIDKMGSSYHGDPKSQLLQILDPEQNKQFFDNYMDVPVNLSNVLFICTANYQHMISKPLIDRMHKISLNSYTNQEKMAILTNYIMPRAMEATGVKEYVTISPEVYQIMIENYTYGQPGVRDLERIARKMMDKVADKVARDNQKVNITKDNFEAYLGQKLINLKDHKEADVGVAIGLGDAWYGSRLTYIQVIGKGKIVSKEGAGDSDMRLLKTTGMLQKEFKQTIQISYTFARDYLLKHHNNKVLFDNQIHLHAPEGAQKKEGPNDAVAIVSAIISFALNKKVKPGFAMTGQLSLTGKVLDVMNCKQRILTAKRQKIENIVMPLSNKNQVDNLEEGIRQGLNIHYVQSYDEVFKLLFE